MLKKHPANRNSQRSIGLITEALLQLMKTESFQSISIARITREAGIVRNTFYAHFRKKDDVLLHHILERFKHMMAHSGTKMHLRGLDLITLYFRFWNSNTELIELIYNNRLFDIIENLDYDMYDKRVNDYFNEICVLSDGAMKYANSAYMSVMNSMLRKWIKTGKEETPEELTDIFCQLFAITD